MSIHLPEDLESSIRAEVANGHFASLDDAMAEAARLLLSKRNLHQLDARTVNGDASPDPLLGCMKDDAALMDTIVEDAYRQRLEAWREISFE